MPSEPLSDALLRSLKPPEKGQRDVWDSTLPGFGIRISQGGSKTFVVNVDKSRRTIGRYPIVKLAEARTEAKRMFAERTLGKVRPQSITYPQALALFLEEKGERRRARTVQDHKRHLNLLGFKCQMADVSHADLERKLKRLPPSEYNHRLSCAKTFFAWAQRKRYREDNPTVGLSPHTCATRDRVLSNTELQCIWRACGQRIAFDDQVCGGFQTTMPDIVKLPRAFATIVKLLVLTGQRRGEIAALRAEYIAPLAHGEQRVREDATAVGSIPTGGSCTITFQATLTKNKREHTFPIGTAASSILSTPLTVSSNGLLFPARGQPSKPFNGWSKSKAALDELSGVTAGHYTTCGGPSPRASLKWR